MTQRLLCVGLTTLDVLGRPIEALPEDGRTKIIDRIVLAPAGTAGGAALVAATLGLPTAIASAVGDDGAGRFVRQEFARGGVDTALLETSTARPTSTTILTIRGNGERPNFHAVGASSFYEVTPALTEAARSAKFLPGGGVGGVKLDGGAGASLLAEAKKAGATITCDLIGPGPRATEELARLLPHVDYFMPNMGEAFYLSGTQTPDAAAARFLGLGAKACIFKWGEKGAYAVIDGQQETVPAHAIAVVDTTSCGDSFCAGFIAGLDHGFTPREACRFASATAALVAQGLGTLGQLGSFDATLAYMRSAPLRSAS
jgi:sugar/nucleoside kinase (ribokinase family)